MGVQFAHPIVGFLNLRLNPTEVEWSYSLNTQVTDTYGGQVIQILSINYDQLRISGRFGKEGPHGIILQRDGTFTGRAVDAFTNWEIGGYGVGLIQMYHFFQEYFAAASQGGDALVQGNYNQIPITLTYGGTQDDTSDSENSGKWNVYPIDFPSFSRSLDNFAPTWTVICEIEEADYLVRQSDTQKEIDGLRANIGYTPFNPFSDPFGQIFNDPNLRQQAALKGLQTAEAINQDALSQVLDHFGNFLPELTQSDIEDLVFSGASFPHVYQKALDQALKDSFPIKKVATTTGASSGAPTPTGANDTAARQATAEKRGLER